jgi:hypothetical protein
MPTGYTHSVQDGTVTDLRTFALICARGMGGLIMMRDDPMDAPIPDRFEPSTNYHDKALAEAREALAEIVAMSPSECLNRQAAKISEAETYRREYVAKKAAYADRYQAMIAKVEAWETEAEGIKDFMLSQLRDSIRFDCEGNYEPAVAEPMDAGDWRQARITELTESIGYHEQERSAEIARTESRNRWIAALKASLPTD